MKKYIICIATTFLFFGNLQAQVSLTIINDSQNGTSAGHYTAWPSLCIMGYGLPCDAYDEYKNLYHFKLTPNTSDYIPDGSYYYTNPTPPYNNSGTIYSYLGTMNLNYTGQRFALYGTYTEYHPYYGYVTYNHYPAGIMGLSTGSIECLSEELTENYDYISSPNSYYIRGYHSDTVTYPYPYLLICDIKYNRYGSLAILVYQ